VSVEETVLGLWRALAKRDWESVTTFLAEDCIYADMPVGPTLAARGPEDIVKRLKVGLEPLAEYTNYDGVLVSNGEDVMYEHSETWTWDSGETAQLPFVSVHKVAHNKVTVWKDYWDFGAIASHAPSSWMEGLASADTTWVFDATGLI
jgi:limonene-1,2-epoxide hydrolase